MFKSISQRSLITLLIFAFIYALISLVNHHLFRTYALDLGLYTNALFDYSHLQFNDSTTFREIPENLLADHFDLYLIGFSPLSYLFGTYTLLIVQIGAILFGAIGVYKFFDRRTVIGNLAFPAMLFFLSFYGVFGALSFDYHSNVIAACFVPWFFLNLEKQDYLKAFIWFIVIIVAKENMAIWLVFIALGGIVHYWKNKRTVLFLSGLMIFAAITFVVITSFVMPAISNNDVFINFFYGMLGDTPKEAVVHLLSHPVEAITNLFVNHKADAIYDYVKTEMHLFVILSGLPFLLRYPGFIIMLIPIYGQKLYHDHPIMWSVGLQYNIEFAPILAIGVFLAIEKIQQKTFRRVAVALVLISTLGVTIRSMDRTIINTNKENLRIYSSDHYSRHYNIQFVREAMKLIPSNAVVSAQSNFVPHLALRDKIYSYPLVNDAEYLLLTSHESCWPLTDSLFRVQLQGYIHSDEWKVLRSDDEVYLFKRE